MKQPARFVALLAALASACAAAPPPSATTSAPAAVPTNQVAWGYDGALAPEHWGDLDPSFAACSAGRAQSPIDLPETVPLRDAARVAAPRWEPVPLSAVNNGHTVEVEDSAASSLVLDGVTYSLVQLHVHVPSEHTLGGRRFDAEMHLVHRSADGKRAVVALLFRSGADNAVLRPLFDALPMREGESRSAGKTLDIAALLGSAPRFLVYDGSLTTPPCTEGVRWLVALPGATPLEISAADLTKLRLAVHADNHRPLQERNGRAVEARGP
jgi:carbonic anhydrase